MTDIQAALGIHQLPRIDQLIERRAEHWAAYDRDLADLPPALPLETPAHMRHAGHLYQVRVLPEAGITRDEMLDELHLRKIGAAVHYRGVHLHPYYRDRYSIDASDLPRATRISDTTLSLPLSGKLSTQDREDVVEALHEILSTRAVSSS